MSKNPPEKTYRIGHCSAKVWANTTNDDRTFRSVSLERQYRDEGNWKSTNSFTLADLPAAMAVLQQAFDYVVSLEGTDPL